VGGNLGDVRGVERCDRVAHPPCQRRHLSVSGECVQSTPLVAVLPRCDLGFRVQFPGFRVQVSEFRLAPAAPASPPEN